MAREREADVRRSLDRLASLRIDPAARSRLAATLIGATARADLLFACGTALEDHPVPEGREPLVAAYENLAANAAKLDAGGALRALVVRALRHVAGREDIELFERAAQVYEVSVQGPAATELRAAAIVALASIAPEIASIHAARLLAEAEDPRKTAPNTGEPALTAARVLGALDETATLYFAAWANWTPPEDVLAECIRQLTGLPSNAVARLFERYGGSRSDIVQLGLVDLAANHEDIPGDSQAVYVQWLRQLDGDVYRYALTTFVASRRIAVHQLAAASVADEFNRGRLAIAQEALAMSRGAAPLEEARRLVDERLGASP